MPGDKDEGTPKVLKEGEVAISEKDWKAIKAKASDMGKFKKRAEELEGDLTDVQDEIKELKEAQKPKEGEPDITSAVEKAVGEVRRDLEKAHKKDMAEQEQRLSVIGAAQLALTEAGAKAIYLGSIDLRDVTDPETAKERVQAFLTENPEVIGRQEEPEHKVPPVTTGPTSGPPPPGGKPDEGPQTSAERDGVLRKQFASDGFAVSRSSGQFKPSG